MKKNIFSFVIMLFLVGGVIGPITSQNVKEYAGISIVHADDDEDEGDDEDGGDDEKEYSSPKSEQIEKAKPIYKTVLIPVIKITLDPIFTIDSDRDGLFDGIDPHPKTHEREYFTDDDGDGVANAFDLYKNEDDFTYYDQETDSNENGIIDSYETLGSN